MKHLIFFYLTFSYSICLLSLAVLAFAYLKTRMKSLIYWIVFVGAGTLPLLFLTYLDYRYVNIPYWFSGYHDVINYMLQSTCIVTLPLLINELFQVSRRALANLLFGIFFFLTNLFILVTFFRGALNNGIEIETLAAYKIFQVFMALAHGYALAVFLRKIKSIPNAKDRNFYILSAFLGVAIFSQSFLNFFETFPEDMIIYAAGVFFWNICFIRYGVGRFFVEPQPSDRESSETIVAKLNLTEREKEVLLLLVGGTTNKEIGAALFISEGTVKTHIQNIYKKLGVRNRVQLFNCLKSSQE